MAEPARALVVEDEERIRLALETLLLEEGFVVRVAHHGGEALAV
jgi:DNA-binding response OmpR family regulator